MILFDLIINFIESFMFSYFLGNYYKVHNKNVYIIIATILQLIFLSIASAFGESGILLSVSIIILMILTLIVSFNKIKFDYVYIVLMYNFFIIITAMGSYAIFEILDNLIVFSMNNIYIYERIFSKIIQIIVTCVIVKHHVNLSTSLEGKDWGIVIGFDFLLLTTVIIAFYAIVIGSDPHGMMTWILVLSFCSSILYRYIIHKIDELNKERVEYARMEELSKYNSEKLTMIKHITEEISKNDHRIFYMLLQMEGYLENEEYDKLKTVIQGYRNLVTKYKLVTNTQNPVFDSLYSMKINDLILKEKNVKNSIFISRRIEYDHLSLIDFITGVLDFFNDCQTIMISMNEVGDTLVVRIIYREGKIEENKVRNYLENKLPKGNVSLENHATKGVRFSIDLGDFNEV